MNIYPIFPFIEKPYNESQKVGRNHPQNCRNPDPKLRWPGHAGEVLQVKCFRPFLRSPRKTQSRCNKYIINKLFMLLQLQIYFTSFYTLLPHLSHGKKLSLVEQRDKEFRRTVSSCDRPTMLQNSFPICHKPLFAETK